MARRLIGFGAVIVIGLLPTVCFGWQGILSSVCLMVAGAFLVVGKRVWAATLTALLLTGQFLHPAMDSARGSVLRMKCEKNIRELTRAIHDYESLHGHLPPPCLTSETGIPLHSWRVLLLPFLGEQSLYDQIDLTRPWYDPVNIPFHDRMPGVYCCAAVRYWSRWGATGNTTSYIVVTGNRTAWRSEDPPGLAQIADGTSSTIAIIESENHRMPWMAPSDPDLATFIKSMDFAKPHNDLMCCSKFDGTTEFLTTDTAIERIPEMLIMDDRKW